MAVDLSRLSVDAAGPGGIAARGRLGSLGSRFLRQSHGATTVEFALISVPFLGLIFAIFQVSLMFLMQQGLKAAVENAARQVLVGKAQTNASIATWQNFRDTLICPASGSILPSFISCPSIVVDVRHYSSFSTLTASAVSQSFLTDTSGPLYQPGNPCDIVIVRAIYPMPVYLPFLADPSLGSSVTASTAGLTSYGGKFVQMLTAAAVFRNEPYNTAGTGTTSAGCTS